METSRTLLRHCTGYTWLWRASGLPTQELDGLHGVGKNILLLLSYL
jgi:hypothetical protein